MSVLLHSPLHLIEPISHFSANHRFIILANEDNTGIGHSALVFYTFILCALTASNTGRFRRWTRLMLFVLCLVFTVATGATVSYISDAVCFVAFLIELSWAPLRRPLYIGFALVVLATSVTPDALTSLLSFVRFDIQGKSQSQYQVQSGGGDVTAGRLQLNSLLLSRIIQSPIRGVGHSDNAIKYGTETLGVDRNAAAKVESPLILAAEYGIPVFTLFLVIVLTPLKMIFVAGPLRILGFCTSVGVIVQSGGNGIAVAHDVSFFCLFTWAILIASPAFFRVGNPKRPAIDWKTPYQKHSQDSAHA